MSSTDSGKYQHYIQRFTFRNKAAITIPKIANACLGRETCYKLSVDVVIESITKPEYRNFRTSPYHGFYGYATLVKRDCLEEKIPLQFGRNRIFEQRIVEAFQGWNELAFYLQTTKKFLEVLANTLRVGDPPSNLVNLCDVEAFSIYWNETDLREVYVKCTKDTQFYIELAWTEPEKFIDNCGKTQDGKSKQPDDNKKDKGLPPNGTQPKKNDPNNPWAGNKPADGVPSDSPYYNDKIGNIDEPDPDNTAIDPFEPRAYQVTATGDFWGGAGEENNAPQNKTAESLGQSVPPFVPVFTPTGLTSGGKELYTVKIIDSEGRQVSFVGCFDGFSCQRIGKEGVNVSWT